MCRHSSCRKFLGPNTPLDLKKSSTSSHLKPNLFPPDSNHSFSPIKSYNATNIQNHQQVQKDIKPQEPGILPIAVRKRAAETGVQESPTAKPADHLPQTALRKAAREERGSTLVSTKCLENRGGEKKVSAEGKGE